MVYPGLNAKNSPEAISCFGADPVILLLSSRTWGEYYFRMNSYLDAQRSGASAPAGSHRR